MKGIISLMYKYGYITLPVGFIVIWFLSGEIPSRSSLIKKPFEIIGQQVKQEQIQDSIVAYSVRNYMSLSKDDKVKTLKLLKLERYASYLKDLRESVNDRYRDNKTQRLMWNATINEVERDLTNSTLFEKSS